MNRSINRWWNCALISSSVLLAVGMADIARADLFSVDLNDADDGLITRDTRTGLEWLDLSQTRDLSYAETAAGTRGLTTDLGFRFATESEVLSLFQSAAEDPNDLDPAGISQRQPFGDEVVQGWVLNQYLGVAQTGRRAVASGINLQSFVERPSFGTVSPASPTVPTIALDYVEIAGTGSSGVDVFSPFRAFRTPQIGSISTQALNPSLLVRDVVSTPPSPTQIPEPAISLIALGCVGGAMFKRQRI